MDEEKLAATIEGLNVKLDLVRTEIGKGITGQAEIIDDVLKVLMCKGHILLESVPGLAKTTLVRFLTQTIKDAEFQRVQFTPDLLPTDITGVTVYEEKRGFYTLKGPIFCNMLLGDEINRTPPKVQSAMLQAMAENEVTIGKETFPLPKPFMVLATQNPLEQQGVYPLSLAQADRFLFKVKLNYPNENDEVTIIDKNIDVIKFEDFKLIDVLSFKDIETIQSTVKDIYIAEEVKNYVVDIVDATRNPENYGIKSGEFLKWGASPRATIYIVLAAKASAFMKNRTFVTPEDVRNILQPVLRHRLILNYEARAREIDPDEVINEIIKKMPVM